MAERKSNRGGAGQSESRCLRTPSLRRSIAPSLRLSFPPSLCLSVALSILFVHTSAAQPSADDLSIDSAQKALSGSGRYPWYDRTKDDVRRLHMTPREGAAQRGKKWEGSAPTPITRTTTAARASGLGDVLTWVGLTALFLALGVIAYMLVMAFLKDEASESTTVRKVVESRRDADRVEALPFHVRSANGDFLSEARRHYDAGSYSQAIIYLFSHQLVELDRNHVIRLTKAKTNRQYIRETRQRPPLAAILEGTMIVFEDAFFGKKSITREAFERCWQKQAAFESELNHLERTAA